MKLAIGIPLTAETVARHFLDSWVLLKKPDFVYCRPMFSTSFSNDIATTRNQIVEQALENDCSHLLFMDTDQTYPDSTIEKLINHNVDIVGAKVHIRYPPYYPTIYRYEHDMERTYLVPESEWMIPQLIEVDATGTGCVMIKTEVFKKMDKPWFEFSKTKDGETIGEDINFCLKAKRLGFKVFVDTSVKCGHIGSLEVNETVYQIYKRIMG